MTKELRFCGNCGGQRTLGGVFCTFCGHAFEGDPVEESTPLVADSQPVDQLPPELDKELAVLSGDMEPARELFAEVNHDQEFWPKNVLLNQEEFTTRFTNPIEEARRAIARLRELAVEYPQFTEASAQYQGDDRNEDPPIWPAFEEQLLDFDAFTRLCWARAAVSCLATSAADAISTASNIDLVLANIGLLCQELGVDQSSGVLFRRSAKALPDHCRKELTVLLAAVAPRELEALRHFAVLPGDQVEFHGNAAFIVLAANEVPSGFGLGQVSGDSTFRELIYGKRVLFGKDRAITSAAWVESSTIAAIRAFAARVAAHDLANLASDRRSDEQHYGEESYLEDGRLDDGDYFYGVVRVANIVHVCSTHKVGPREARELLARQIRSFELGRGLVDRSRLAREFAYQLCRDASPDVFASFWRSHG